jgi:uncharacterized membrane protein YphA (DoxX/SURF4 family)
MPGATPWLSLVLRLVLAALFAAAALSKIGEPQATVRAVRAYQLAPEWLVHPLAYSLPYIELAIALLLLLGLMVRLTGGLVVVMLAGFMLAVTSAWGLRIDCGCFGGGGASDDPQYALELLRDGIALGAGVLLVAFRRSALSLDSALEL